jgi:hypothetical protein
VSQLLAVILIAAVIGWLLRGVVSRQRLFEIRVTREGVEIQGSIRGAAQSDVREFVASLNLPHGARIRGYPENGYVKLEFNRVVPEAQHQRIRNFLLLRI